ncbi:glycosyltransferase family 2 protein [Vibrio furnissii]|uniref:glycosyltransferase family 2 protein n=1 Tax=Vibrio furnissii TaxID=29494 RepID=UPI003AA80DE4
MENIFDLSIIIPTCNRNDFLERAVNSILYQIEDVNYVIEVIIVDDSFDFSSKFLIEKFAKYSSVRFVKNISSRNNAASTRNFGVSVSRAKYIMFLDDDDMYLPGRIEGMLKFAYQNSQYSLISSCRFYESNNFTSIYVDQVQKHGVISIDDILYNNIIDIGFLISRELFIELGGFDDSLSSLEDWDFLLRALYLNDAYKLPRYDYLVNIDINRERVSTGQWKSRVEIARKYKNTFCRKWYFSILSSGLGARKELRFYDALAFTFKARSLAPIKNYLKMVIR